MTASEGDCQPFDIWEKSSLTCGSKCGDLEADCSRREMINDNLFDVEKR